MSINQSGCPTVFLYGSDSSSAHLSALNSASSETSEERPKETHSWPWNTSWDSSAIFHTLTERSLPPAVTQRSRLKLSSPVIASWCPKLQQITVTAKVKHWSSMQVFGCETNHSLISYSQSFHICVLIHVPHLYWAIMRGAVQIMSPLPEWKTLTRIKDISYDSREDLWVIVNSVNIKTEKLFHAAERERGRTYRHRAFVSCEFI